MGVVFGIVSQVLESSHFHRVLAEGTVRPNALNVVICVHAGNVGLAVDVVFANVLDAGSRRSIQGDVVDRALTHLADGDPGHGRSVGVRPNVYLRFGHSHRLPRGLHPFHESVHLRRGLFGQIRGGNFRILRRPVHPSDGRYIPFVMDPRTAWMLPRLFKSCISDLLRIADQTVHIVAHGVVHPGHHHLNGLCTVDVAQRDARLNSRTRLRVKINQTLTRLTRVGGNI